MQDILDIKQSICYSVYTGRDKMKNIKIKIARLEKGLKQSDLANIVGVTRQTIGLIESGGYNPSLNLCISICKALGKTLDELFWEDSTDEE